MATELLLMTKSAVEAMAADSLKLSLPQRLVTLSSNPFNWLVGKRFSSSVPPIMDIRNLVFS